MPLFKLTRTFPLAVKILRLHLALLLIRATRVAVGWCDSLVDSAKEGDKP